MQIDSSWERRSCPLCNSKKVSQSEVKSTPSAELMSWNEVKDLFVGLRSRQIFFSYHRCLECNLLYCPWYFSNKQLEILYKEMPNNLMGGKESTASRTQAGYVQWFAKDTKQCRNFLEIGPDIGLVTKKVVQIFNPQKITLIEANIAVHEELLSNAGFSAEVIVAENLKQVKIKSFDFTIGIHIFDHLLDPLKTLKNLNALCIQSAILGIVVHNEESNLRKLLRNKWPPFCLQHPQLYSPKTLKLLLQKSGWENKKISKSINYFKLNQLALAGFNLFNLPSFFSRLIPSFELPLPLGNIIIMAEKK